MQSSALVFIIDDDASMRQGVGRWLESVGYKSEAFESAIDFLARSPHPGPCCVIVDVHLSYRPRQHSDVRPRHERRSGRFSSKTVHLR